jgi:hydroxymethylpyrimidine pyrophosphatase-like HAD family hydrolase
MCPNPSAVKALALDLDGTTLRPDNTLSERTLGVIRSCLDRGIQVIICTGRAVEAAERYRAALAVPGPHVYFNGAVVAEMPGWKILSITLQDKESAGFCLELARKTGLYFQAFFPGTPEHPRQRVVAERACPEWEAYRRHTGITPELGDLAEILADPAVPGCVKTMFIAGPEAQARVRPCIEERYGADLYIAGSLGQFLEIMNPHVSKGTGLRIALKARGLDDGGIIAFGDEENDLPLFKAAGFSAATANAKETVRSRADLVIGSNAEDGVAAFLEELFRLR